jgi:hypothetical protein
MSDLLNQASLVMVPSGYKEDTVYSVVPSDGSGDLSFTRASNGTRVNSAGLVEVCPWNLCTYSEDQTQWTSQNETTVTANSTTAPNGTLTADTVTPTAVNDDHYRGIGLSSQVGELTAFIYVKPNGYNFFDWGIWNGSSYLVRATFDLVNLTYTFTNAGTATIESVGNGWLKCGISGSNASLSTIDLYYRVRPTGGAGGFTGNGTSGAFVWGAQLNIGSTAKPYFPTTDRLNVPRLTYQNGGGGCPSLLLEKQSTNLALYSQALSTSPNIVDSSTVTANVYISPDGTQNAMQFTETTANDRHGFYQYTSVTAQTYTASIFTKQTGRRYISLDSDMTGTQIRSFFDLQTISVVSSGSGHTCSIQDFGNGWLRLNVTFTAVAGSRFIIWCSSTNGTTNVYAGSTSFSQTFWGYQLEASSYPTSYIPTTSSSATRVADACFKTGISSLIGSTTGSVFVDFEIFTTSEFGGIIEIINTSSTGQRLLLWENASTSLELNISGGIGGGSIGTTATIGRHKAVFTYTASAIKFFLDGVKIGQTTPSTLTGGFDKLDFEHSQGGVFIQKKNINQALVSKSAFTEAEAIALTTL